MKNLILVITVLLSFSVFAEQRVQIKILRGDVTFNGKKINLKSNISEGGMVKVGPRSLLKIYSTVYNSSIVLGQNTELEIKFEKGKKKLPYTLINGISRWVTEGESKQKGGMKTKTTIFGVRGTDFITIANKDLGESEIICFDGKVQMYNRKNRKDNALVGKNQWGGLGGRFGSKIGKILDLPPRFIESTKTMLPLK